MLSLNAGIGGCLLTIRVLCVLGLLVSAASIICGALGVHFVQYALEVATWPTMSGSGIWCGASMAFCCIMGLVATFCKPDMKGSFKILAIIHNVSGFATISLSFVNLDYSIKILTSWTENLEMWYCVGDYPFVVSMASMNIILSLILAAIGICLVTMTTCTLKQGGCKPCSTGCTVQGSTNPGFVAAGSEGRVLAPPPSNNQWSTQFSSMPPPAYMEPNAPNGKM